MKIAFVTCRAFPEISEDDSLAAKACQALGLEVEARTWEEKAAPWNSYSAVILRSTWNYYRRAPDFSSWVGSVENKNFWNPRSVVQWNIDKNYLRELESKGIPIVPTKWVSNGPDLNLQALADELGSQELVIKPPISADGHRTIRLSKEDWNSASALSDFRGGDFIMVQPYLDSILTKGELSFVFLGGEFSHAVKKTPKTGEFRVQEKLGGKIEPLEEPPGDCLELALEACKKIESDLLYARVDILQTPKGPLLTEFELTEPSLYFKHNKKAPAKFASALKERLK